jgi:hypothetical protein
MARRCLKDALEAAAEDVDWTWMATSRDNSQGTCELQHASWVSEPVPVHPDRIGCPVTLRPAHRKGSHPIIAMLSARHPRRGPRAASPVLAAHTKSFF